MMPPLCRRPGVPFSPVETDEDVLREVKAAVFNAGVIPARAYVEFFAEAMRWPVDALAPQTVHTSSDTEHRVAWLKSNEIGMAVCIPGGEKPILYATVRPLTSATRAEVGALVKDDGFSPTVVRSLTVHFVDGDPLIVDLATFSTWTQRQQADAFIDAVLSALSESRLVNP